MNWYKDNKDVWKEIIETVAAEEHRTVQMVEKDTIQSMFLSGISQSGLPFVFKGGTSLSKAHGLMLKEIISSRFYESDYNDITKKLLYEDVSYNKAIENGIALVAAMDIFEYKK